MGECYLGGFSGDKFIKGTTSISGTNVLAQFNVSDLTIGKTYFVDIAYSGNDTYVGNETIRDTVAIKLTSSTVVTKTHSEHTRNEQTTSGTTFMYCTTSQSATVAISGGVLTVTQPTSNKSSLVALYGRAFDITVV